MSDEMILSRLEDWRKRNGLKKTDMANILRLKQSQNYTNWIARRSIPKEYMLHAHAILNADDSKEAEIMIKAISVNEEKAEYMTPIMEAFSRELSRVESTLVPLISWVQAGDWSEAVDLFEAGEAETMLPCPVTHSVHTFALRVDGDSMTSPSGKSYPHGAIIFVDPEQRGGASPGDRVIAKLNGEDQVTFKQLAEDRQGKYLKPLNPNHQPIYGEFRILGKVIGMWIDD